MITKKNSTFTAEWTNPKLKVGHVVLFVAVVCLSLIAVSIWGAFSSLQYHLNDKETEMSNLAKTLSSNIEATLTQADTALLGIKGIMESENINSGELKKIEGILQAQQKRLPQVHGFFIYDSQGKWLLNSNGVMPPGANNSDREYFKYHQSHDDLSPHLGESIQSRSTGDWIMTVSRRINHPDGSFAGVALATINLKYFLSLYEGVDMGKNGVINLISSDGIIIVRKPFNERDIGISIAKGEVFALLLSGTHSGTATIKSFIDGVERIIGFRRVNGYPLVVIAAFDRGEILSEWKRESLASLIVSAALLLILSFLGQRLARLIGSQIQAQRELQKSQQAYIKDNKALGLLASQDGLTGLSNRRQFDLFLKAEVGLAKRKIDSTALIMIDIDLFKSYNDQYGHVQGDECLKTVGAIIKECVNRSGDLAARYSGEEFAVVLTNTDYVGAFLLAEKIRRAIEDAMIEHGESPLGKVTASLGVSVCEEVEISTPDSLVMAADKALYAAKSSGRNRTVISS